MTRQDDSEAAREDLEITRIREVRTRISERFGHDPYRLVAHYMERQQEHRGRLLPSPEPEVLERSETS